MENVSLDSDRRGKNRIISSDYLDFRVSAEKPSIKEANLGNISEGGLQFLLPASESLPEDMVNSDIQGQVYNHRTNMNMKFKGKVLWQSERDLEGKKYYAFGVQFNADVLLPEAIYAVLLANSEL